MSHKRFISDQVWRVVSFEACCQWAQLHQVHVQITTLLFMFTVQRGTFILLQLYEWEIWKCRWIWPWRGGERTGVPGEKKTTTSLFTMCHVFQWGMHQCVTGGMWDYWYRDSFSECWCSLFLVFQWGIHHWWSDSVLNAGFSLFFVFEFEHGIHHWRSDYW